MKRLALAFALAALMPSAAALATQQGVAVMKSWKAEDNCARQAQLSYPDYTADAIAKREAAFAACTRNSMLPPREPLPSSHP